MHVISTMRRRRRWLILALVVPSIAILASAGPDPLPVAAQAQFYVNTTIDIPAANEHCLPAQPCPLRGAIERAESQAGGAIITACFDSAVVPDATPCPLGRDPLTADDPGFDPDTGRWVITMSGSNPPFTFSSGGTQINFSRGIEGWSNPADNRVAVDGTGADLEFAFRVESSGNRFVGFGVIGAFRDSAFLLQSDFFDSQVSDNHLGPGLGLFGITSGNGIKIQSPEAVANRVVGNWCGITGDGTETSRVAEDCIYVLAGARSNVIGGPTDADRNVLTASRRGVAVKIEGRGTDDNIVEGNWLGIDAKGVGRGAVQNGVLVVNQAARTVVRGNVVGGATGEGIAVFGRSAGTRIEANLIGVGPDGVACQENNTYGLTLNDGPSDSTISENVIRCHDGGGILIQGRGSTGNLVTRNRITDNAGPALSLARRANRGVQPPELVDASRTRVSGVACPGCAIEIFSDPGGEAAVYEGSVTANESDGTFIFEPQGGFQHDTVTATSTDGRDTSALSRFAPVTGGGTAGPPRPTPTRGPIPTDVLFRDRISVPIVVRSAAIR